MRIIFFFLLVTISVLPQNLIIDSDLTFDEATSGIVIPKSIISQLVLLNVEYYSFDSKLHKGQIIVNKSVEKEIISIFNSIKKEKFPIEKVIPLVKYNWDDEISMKDNNTSCFNYRTVKGSKKLSKHALGLAIDINPRLNPQIKNKNILPPNGKYLSTVAGTITKNNTIYKLFLGYGWKWGGNWRSSKDYQHFEK